MLPNASESDIPDGDSLPNVLKQYLRSNSSFRADVRLFQEDLSAGHYEPQWLRDAQTAMDKRAQGDFDSWKERNREAFWGQKQKTQYEARAGESSQHSLEDLVGAGYFQVGDVWLMHRGLGHGRDAVSVDKELKV